MNAKKLFFIGGLLIGSLSACNFTQQVTPVPAAPTPTVFDLAANEKNEIATLSSLEKVDDYPLYTMRYYGEYDFRRVSTLIDKEKADPGPGWACALFTVLLDDEHLLYGRNFDWEFSPALLVFTDPPDGYASVSMVDMAYLEIGDQDVLDLTELPLEEGEVF